MKRAVLTYMFLVLAPSAFLAVFAFRVADWDHTERLEAHRSSLQTEADALARRIEGAIADGMKRAERDDAIVAYARDGTWLGYSPDPADIAPGPAPGAEEVRLYQLSLRGGESFEFVRNDPARAVDAYAFFLPRIPSPALRSNLRFRTARAAMAAGQAALGKMILRDLFDDAEGLSTEEGMPIDLLAAGRLVGVQAAGDGDLRRDAVARIRNTHRRLETALLAHLANMLAPQDRSLLDLAERRRALERAVAAHPEILRSRDAVLGEGYLLFARPVSPGGGAPSLRGIRLASVDLPPLSAGDFSARLERPGLPAPGGGHGVSRPIRPGEAGPELAVLRLEDPHFAEKLAAFDRRRAIHRGLVGLLVVVALGGGIALVRYISRERHLARLRARLIANVSHELKTPVTSIRMFSEMMADDRMDTHTDQGRRIRELLRAESFRLSQLLQNLLDLSRFGRGDDDDNDVSMEPVDIPKLLRRIAEGFSYRAREGKVDFRSDGIEGDGSGGLVLTDAAAVERIVLNLLDNALKYGREGKPEVRLGLVQDGEHVKIQVADNGPGIPRREREQVFEEFYRLSSDDHAVKGSGLGLAISRRLARSLGGDIILEDAGGGGSVFTLKLPLKGYHGPGTDSHR